MSRLQVTASPHLGNQVSTRRIMWTVAATLLPAAAVGVWTFGPSAALVMASSLAGALATEWAFGRAGSLFDGSAVITGLLVGMCLPATIPLWMAFLGAAAGIGLGKVIFGGLGQNVFNPALLGRAFLQAAFPVAMTTWPTLDRGSWWSLAGDNFAMPLMSASVDALSGATPLGLMKFEQTATPAGDLFFGSVSGSVGEGAAVAILLGGAYLAWKMYLDWRIPAGVFATVAALSTALHWFDPVRYPDAAFALLSGGLLLGAVYMATDPVTAPITHRGRWIFGAGIGALVVLIRSWGGLPEGVMYAILLMNALVPFINRVTQPRVFGTRRAEVSA